MQELLADILAEARKQTALLHIIQADNQAARVAIQAILTEMHAEIQAAHARQCSPSS